MLMGGAWIYSQDFTAPCRLSGILIFSQLWPIFILYSVTNRSALSVLSVIMSAHKQSVELIHKETHVRNIQQR